MKKLTLKQLSLLSHSLGIDLFQAVVSLKKKDKQLPEQFYRNYFNTSQKSFDFEYIKELISIGVINQFRPEFF